MKYILPAGTLVNVSFFDKNNRYELSDITTELTIGIKTYRIFKTHDKVHTIVHTKDHALILHFNEKALIEI